MRLHAGHAPAFLVASVYHRALEFAVVFDFSLDRLVQVLHSYAASSPGLTEGLDRYQPVSSKHNK